MPTIDEGAEWDSAIDSVTQGSMTAPAVTEEGAEWDSAIDTVMNDSADKRRANLYGAVRSNPDQYGEAVQMSRATGLPAPVVSRNLDDVKRRLQLEAIDTTVDSNSTLARQLENQDFANIAHDDVENLKAIEGNLAEPGFFGKIGSAFNRGLTSSLRAYDADAILESTEILQAADAAERGDTEALSKSRYASMFAGVQGTPEKVQQTRAYAQARYAENLTEYLRRTGDLEGMKLPKDFQNFSEAEGAQRTIGTFLDAPVSITGQLLSQSLGQLLPSAPLMVGGGVAGGVRGLMAGTGASSFMTGYANDIAAALVEMGVDVKDPEAVKQAIASPEFQEKQQQAFTKNAVIGTVDAATAGVMGVRLATKPAANIAAQTGVQMAGGAGGEVAGSVASGQEASFNAAFSEAIAEIPGAGFDASVLAARRMMRGQDKALQATQDAAALDQLRDLATASKVRPRDVQSFEQFVQAAGGTQDVYLDAQTMQQAGIDPAALAAVSPSAAAQMEEALATGGDIVIPVSEYAGRVVGTDLDALLAPHLRTAEDALSPDEAQRFFQTQAEEFKAQAEQVMEERAADTAWQASAKEVESNLLEQLKGAGRFTDDVNTAYSTLMRDFYVTTAARLGITPTEMFSRYPLQVRAESVAADARMDQGVSPAAVRAEAERISKATGAKVFLEVGQSGQLQLASIKVPEGEQSQGAGTKAITEIKKFADKTGRNVVLTARARTPDLQPRLEAFYERNGFVKFGSDPLNKSPYYGYKAKAQEQRPPQQTLLQRAVNAITNALGIEQPQQAQPAPAETVNAGQPLDMSQFFQGEAVPLPPTVEVDGKQRSTTNANGRSIAQTEEGVRNFWRWFGDSVFVDDQGRPQVMYHSTLDENKEQFDKAGKFMGYTGVSGISVTDSAEMASRYLDRFGDVNWQGKPFSKNVIPLYVKAENPLYRDEPFETNLRLGAPLPEGYVSVVERQGYDALVRNDAISRKGAVKHSDAKNAIRGREIVVFNPEQIKSAIGNRGTFDPNDRNILNQGEQGEQEKDLIIQHNLSAENLANAVKVGGLAVPSLAITRAGNAITGFGEITLLGDAGTATPGGDTKVFGADIYSPRYPRIEYKLDSFALKRLNRKLEPFNEGREIYGGDISNIDDLIGNEAFKRFAADKLGASEPNTTGYHELRSVASGLLVEVEADERIFQGYTNSGNRKYIPHTLDNVVKILKKELRGGEGFNYGVGSVRAQYTPQFRTLNAIRKEKGRLTTREDFEKVKTEVDKEFWDLGERLKPFHPASSSFGFGDAVSLMMSDAAKMGLPRALRENGFEDVSPEVAAEVADYFNKLRNLPTEYFEAKITRAVDIGEFAAAVVPDSVKPEARAALEKAGVPVYEYKKGDDASRREAVKRAAEERGLFFQPQTAQPGNRGEISFSKDITQSPSVITLFKNADLSTFLHEMGHFQLEVLANIASRPDAPQAIVDDMNAALKWFGITGDETVQGGDTAGQLGQGSKYLEALRAGEVPVPEGGFSVEDKRGFGDLWRKGFAVVEERDGKQFLRLGRGNWYEEATAAQQKVLDSMEVASGVFRDLDFRSGTDDVYQVAEAFFTDSEVAPQTREVPFSTLGELLPGYDTPTEAARIQALADAIKENGEITPVIIGVDPTGEAFIMEGQHRARALQLLGYDAVPARVVVDMTDSEGVLSQGESKAGLPPLGPKKEGRTPLDVWNAMSLEEKRPYHEQFARGFEAYLFEGKAPNAELQNLFQRFRAWLVNVYKSIKALNVELSPEIRGVFDRLLATDETIKQAEAMRAMAPLFTTPEEMGDTPQAFIDYQRMGVEASRDAQDDLAKRGLKDMQWLTNARSRILKQLQKDAKEKRQAVEAEVRAEVEAMPVYAAQRFLRRGEMTAPDGDEIKVEKGFRLDTGTLAEMYPESMLARPALEKLQGMTRKDGLHPDLVAEMFDGFTSGDHLVRELINATPMAELIEGMTDQRVLERYGDIANPDTLARAADEAIHNDARARFVATELKALTKAQGPVRAMTKAAKELAETLIARKKVRDIKPNQFAAAETRAAKNAEKALKSGDSTTAANEKRNQLVQNYATRAAYDAVTEIEKAVRYLRKFDNEGTRKNIDSVYTDQIDALLERFDLRAFVTNKDARRRASLIEWVESQREQGFEPDIPPDLISEAMRKPYREMTLEELRGLVDTVKQIEHIGRLKQKLLTAKDEREFAVVVADISQSINDNAQGRTAETRTPTDTLGKWTAQLKRFWASHIKAAAWSRIMDGGQDGGPMWEYFIRTANEKGDMETQMRADATIALSKILSPVVKTWPKLQGKGRYFASVGRAFTREGAMALALNTGNAGNLQRMLGGEGWTLAQIRPVLESLTAQEWQAVQAVWDHFETYKPEIAAKERRIYGKEPNWVEPVPFTIRTADGQEVNLKGGYYPIKYDPAASQQAEAHADAESAKQDMRGAYTAATTRRSFTKARAEEVTGRPLLYSLVGVYSGVNEVIHDLSWHEWLIDANRLLRNKAIDQAIRSHYGPQVKDQFKLWVKDVAQGETRADSAAEIGVSWLRQSVSAAGLGFNVMSALVQVTGFPQSMARVGFTYAARGLAQYAANPIRTAREVVGKSTFMADRSRTQFRELNELRNQVEGQTAAGRALTLGTYFLMMRMQKMVDVPTWLGAYEKAIATGNNEERSIALADQAVIDSQGSGMIKDLSTVERGGQALKLFTVFYSYMNTALNAGTVIAMTERNKAKLAAKMLMIYTVPMVLGYALKNGLTPGGGDDDDESLAAALLAEQVSFLTGLMVGAREFGEIGKIMFGAGGVRDYSGPAGVRVVSDAVKFAGQARQGEFDDAFRKASVNLLGDLTGLPAAQINRTITGIKALEEGQTDNPAAVVLGYQR